VGERDHSKLQREFVVFFHLRRKSWNVCVFPEQRIQVSASRFRIPDVCVYLGKEPQEQVFRTPPFICIEILSPLDRKDRIAKKVDDYRQFGVRHIWVVDPGKQRAWICDTGDWKDVVGGVLRTEEPILEVSLAEIFAELNS
jgi:Uma2 family endonuclease